MRALEAFIGSAGVTLFGFISIPLVASFVGVNITQKQGAMMGAIFFVMRFIWLYILRVVFSKKGESCNKCEEK